MEYLGDLFAHLWGASTPEAHGGGVALLPASPPDPDQGHKELILALLANYHLALVLSFCVMALVSSKLLSAALRRRDEALDAALRRRAEEAVDRVKGLLEEQKKVLRREIDGLLEERDEALGKRLEAIDDNLARLAGKRDTKKDTGNKTFYYAPDHGNKAHLGRHCRFLDQANKVAKLCVGPRVAEFMADAGLVCSGCAQLEKGGKKPPARHWRRDGGR